MPEYITGDIEIFADDSDSGDSHKNISNEESSKWRKI